MNTNTHIKLGLVDDHVLFRRGLITLIESISNDYTILFEADNGRDLQKKISTCGMPDILLMDINMPDIDGFHSMEWLNKHNQNIKVIVVSMIEKEETILRMLKLGIKGYLCKDVEPEELHAALTAVSKKGYYYTDFITGRLLHALQSDSAEPGESLTSSINNKEREFVELACSELTYSEIADKMHLSPKTIDGYRSMLFDRWNIKSRVGLVLFAIRNNLFKP